MCVRMQYVRECAHELYVRVRTCILCAHALCVCAHALCALVPACITCVCAHALCVRMHYVCAHALCARV